MLIQPRCFDKAKFDTITLKMFHWKYKNLTYLTISLLLAAYVFNNENLHSILLHLGNLGYIGAFFAGILFVSTFTVSIGTIIFLILAESLSPIELGIIAGLGAVVGDFLIFHLVRDNLAQEVAQLYNAVDANHHVQKVLHTKYFAWTLPVFGALIIASPLPDEIGVSLMGISRMSTIKFAGLSFVLNTLGIFLIASASTFVKP